MSAGQARACELAALLKAVRGVTGPAGVVEDDRELARYRDPFSFLDDDPHIPAAAVRPAGTDQVRQIVRLAAARGCPLWPISGGKNLAYGGAAPAAPGAVILDLGHRMNQVLEVSEDLGYARVQPGVTYQALYEHLQQAGSHLQADVPDLGWGSVVGNLLERGNGYGPAPYGDHWASHCGLEVVLPLPPPLDLIRTGMGAMPGAGTWQAFPYGYGPLVDGLFSQSNLGVVTEAGIWLMPRPPAYQAYAITVPRPEDLGPLVDAVRPLRLSGIMPNVAAIRSLLLEAAFTSTRRDWHDGPGPVPAAVQDRIAAELGLGYWTLYAAAYGTEGIVAAQLAEVRAAIAGLGKLVTEAEQPGSALTSRARIMAGIPSVEAIRILNWAGEPGGHVNISPVCPARGADAAAQYEFARGLCEEHGVDYAGDFIVGGRELHHILMLIFALGDAGQKRRCRDLAVRLIDGAAERGWGVYRTHLAFMSQVAATYDFNNGALPQLFGLLKAAIDPSGTLAPGKQGIWPAGPVPAATAYPRGEHPYPGTEGPR